MKVSYNLTFITELLDGEETEGALKEFASSFHEALKSEMNRLGRSWQGGESKATSTVYVETIYPED